MPTTTDKPKRRKWSNEAKANAKLKREARKPVDLGQLGELVAPRPSVDKPITHVYTGWTLTGLTAWRSFLATAPMPAIRIAVCQAAAYKGKARFTAMPMDEWDGSDFFSVSRFDDKMVVSHFVNHSQMAAATECVNRSKELIGNSERIIRREEGFLEFETDPSLVKQRNQFVADARAASEQAFRAKEEAEALLSTRTVNTWGFCFEECV